MLPEGMKESPTFAFCSVVPGFKFGPYGENTIAMSIVVKDEAFDATDSATICAFTTGVADAPLFHVPVEPNEHNGLHSPCRLMVDMITTVPKFKVGTRVGRLDDEDIVRLNSGGSCFSRSGRFREGEDVAGEDFRRSFDTLRHPTSGREFLLLLIIRPHLK